MLISNLAFISGISVLILFHFHQEMNSKIKRLFIFFFPAAGALIVREAGGVCIDTEGMYNF